MKDVTWANSDTCTALTMMTEQKTFVLNGVTWANSGTRSALTMITEQRTSVMKGVTWANSVTLYNTYNEDRAEHICQGGPSIS